MTHDVFTTVWNCPTCGYPNRISDSVCQHCKTLRPDGVVVPAPDVPPPSPRPARKRGKGSGVRGPQARRDPARRSSAAAGPAATAATTSGPVFLQFHVVAAFGGGIGIGILLGLIIFLPGLVAGIGSGPQQSAPVAIEESLLPVVPPTLVPSESAFPSESPPPTALPAPTDAPGTYTVRTGDTLFSIASRYGVTEDQLREWNVDTYPSLRSSPRRIRVGWVLSVVPPATPTPVPTPAPPAA